MKSFALLLLFLAGIGSIFGAIVLAILSERRRPVPSSDDVTDGHAHGDWPAIPDGCRFHNRSSGR